MYIAVLDIYWLLKDDYIAITWAVICDAKRFFHTQVHPSELTQHNPQYPVSHFASVLLDIQNMVPVVRGSLPLAWRLEQNRVGGGVSQQSIPFHAAAPAPLALPMPPMPTHGGSIPLPYAAHQPFNQQHVSPTPVASVTAPPTNQMGHVNPIIRECFKEYHQKFGGRVMLSKIMKAANIDWPQMPYLLHLWDGKKSNLVTAMYVECAASRSVRAKPKVVMFRATSCIQIFVGSCVRS